jgi:hypothetical protein
MTKDEALLIALEALEVANSLVDAYYLPKEKAWLPEIEEAITAIKAVQEAKDEPVGYFSVNDYGNWEENESNNGTPLYTTPPQRKPLTDEEITKIFSTTKGFDFYLNFARAIEAAHGIT